MAKIVFFTAVAIAMLIVLVNSFQEVKKKATRKVTKWRDYLTCFFFLLLLCFFHSSINLRWVSINTSLISFGKKYWKTRMKEMVVAINWKSSLRSVSNSPMTIETIKLIFVNSFIRRSASFISIVKINSDIRTAIKFKREKIARITNKDNNKLLLARLSQAELCKGWINISIKSITAPTIQKRVKSIAKENLLNNKDISKKKNYELSISHRKEV